MKFPLLCATALCAALSLSAQPTPPVVAPGAAVATNKGIGPRLTFGVMEHDFGKIPDGSAVQYTFVFTNTGDETLVINSVRPGCHCTTARPWTPKVEPGQTGEIPLQYDSHGQHGDITRVVSVGSNDRTNSAQQLILKGKIWKVIEVSPDIGFIQVHPDATNTLLVSITNTLDQPIELSSPKSDNASFTAVLKTNKPGKEFEILITALPPFKPNQNNAGVITVETTYTNVPQLRIQAFAIVPPSTTH